MEKITLFVLLEGVKQCVFIGNNLKPTTRRTNEPAPVPEPTTSDVEPVQSQPAQGHTTTIPLNKIFAFLDIPPAAYEFAALLQAVMSYELVDWLAKRLQFIAEQWEEEHKYWEMIQKAMLGELTPKEERKCQHIEQQPWAKKNGINCHSNASLEYYFSRSAPGISKAH